MMFALGVGRLVVLVAMMPVSGMTGSETLAGAVWWRVKADNLVDKVGRAAVRKV